MADSFVKVCFCTVQMIWIRIRVPYAYLDRPSCDPIIFWFDILSYYVQSGRNQTRSCIKLLLVVEIFHEVFDFSFDAKYPTVGTRLSEVYEFIVFFFSKTIYQLKSQRVMLNNTTLIHVIGIPKPRHTYGHLMCNVFF
jgi:hypothetical protein